MCGIVGYCGEREALPFLITGLKRLEYRGYDSRGFAVQDKGKTRVHKTTDLKSETPPLQGHIGIAHTRWATTGKVNDSNAHPHKYKGISVVHNGIISKHRELREELMSLGHEFSSETDSEVIPHAISQWGIEEAIKRLGDDCGAFLAMDDLDPDKMWAYSDGAPLLVSGRYVASDINALSGYTDQASRLIPKRLLVIRKGMKIPDYREMRLKNLDHENPIKTFDIREDTKGPFEHYMLKEIHEQPKCLKDMGGDRLQPAYIKKSRLRRAVILGCGTSYYAGMILKRYLHDTHSIESSVEYASEFEYNHLDDDTHYIAISQSGETKDVIESIKDIPSHKLITFHNSPNSTITNYSKYSNYIEAGPEIGVAATKTFTASCMRMWQWMEWIDDECYYRHQELIDDVSLVINMSATIHDIAKQIYQYDNFLILGSGYHYPIALESALKLKEVAYVHAEAMPAAEMKHGPLALVDSTIPSIVFCMEGDNHERIEHNIEEIKSRGGNVLVITNLNNIDADWMIKVPKNKPHLQPIVSVVAAQLLSYHIATLRGCHVDRPRNLAKSVTVL